MLKTKIKMETVEISSVSRVSVGKRLTELYESMNLKRTRFAESLGVKYETLRSYEKGAAEPGSVFFKKLKEVYPSVDIGWILTGEPTEERPSELMDVRRVPVVHSIPAGGFTLGIPDEDVREFAFTTDLKTKGLFGLQVRGQSMEPEVREGDIVLLAPDLPFVNGEVYAVISRGSEATLKKVYRTKDGWTLVPLNPVFESTVLREEDVIKLYRMVSIHRNYI